MAALKGISKTIKLNTTNLTIRLNCREEEATKERNCERKARHALTKPKQTCDQPANIPAQVQK